MGQTALQRADEKLNRISYDDHISLEEDELWALVQKNTDKVNEMVERKSLTNCEIPYKYVFVGLE